MLDVLPTLSRITGKADQHKQVSGGLVKTGNKMSSLGNTKKKVCFLLTG